MNRWIDTMDFDDLGTFIDYLASAEADLDELEIRGELEALFAPVHWSDNLDPEDKQTWVLCCLSDESSELSGNVDWVSHVDDHRYVTVQYDSWKYATPIDLGLRYNNGEDTL